MEESDHYDSDSDGSSRNRVTVLQDICLTPQSKSSYQRMKELYPGLKLVEATAELDVSSSDDVYLFRMPKNIDPKSLKKIEIDLEDECKINLGEKYVIKPTTRIPDPSLVVSATPRVLQFKSNIIMEKYIKSRKELDIAVPEKTPVPLPENLKDRHPLFGVDFLEKIQLSGDVERKLDDAIDNFVKQQRKSKKKKEKKNRRECSEEVSQQNIFNVFSSPLPSVDRIKREPSDDSAIGSSSSTDTSARNKGKKKKGMISTELVKQEREEESLSQARTSKTPRKKKKSENPHSWLDISIIKNEVTDISNVKSEIACTSSKNSTALLNSTPVSGILSTPKFSAEISTIVSEPSSSGKKPKKSKREKVSYSDSTVKKEDLISELLHNVTVDLNASVKKSKKKRKHEEDVDLSKTIKLEF